ncbi:MAG: EamA family transporter [Alphaproteobacteria bacterium]|jgi:drug/metabolite transporter (DMT)-like permease|nr:EamA family transporter [Alphaproteobacteria bacterium]MBT4085560.1 EamA family transporter [Alphaproteobacteria bacterium]MBT4544329.1 EamA family transporter [Alphaproteobacteria bacterium]
MELWIPITIAAAFFQNLRSMLQKYLKDRLSTGGATYARFIYAWPFAVIYVLVLGELPEFDMPSLNTNFAFYAAIGGAAQMLATTLLIYLFSFRNFAVGTTFSKTETVQAAIFGAVILADPLSVSAIIAILISLVGVVALSAAQSGIGLGRIVFAWTERTSLIGLASGASFGVSAVSYRAASLSLGGDGFLIQAAFTLAWVLGFQTIVMGVYLLIREPGELARVLRNWRVGSWVGVTGMIGSVGWFTAMTIQNAAYVRALGQVELVFTFIAAHMFFGERSTRLEVAGIVLVVVGILVLLLG